MYIEPYKAFIMSILALMSGITIGINIHLFFGKVYQWGYDDGQSALIKTSNTVKENSK